MPDHIITSNPVKAKIDGPPDMVFPSAAGAGGAGGAGGAAGAAVAAVAAVVAAASSVDN